MGKTHYTAVLYYYLFLFPESPVPCFLSDSNGSNKLCLNSRPLLLRALNKLFNFSWPIFHFLPGVPRAKSSVLISAPGVYIGFILWKRSPEWPKATNVLGCYSGILFYFFNRDHVLNRL